MTAKYEMFMNCSKNIIGICKKKSKYDCQTMKTYRIMYVKEKMLLTNVKYLRLSTEHFMDIIHICVQYPSYWHKYRTHIICAKQRIHKWSLMVKNKYVWQMHSIDALLLLSSKCTGLLVFSTCYKLHFTILFFKITFTIACLSCN